MDVLNSDRPIGPDDRDELGFRSIAQRYSEAILRQTGSAGVVFALEGKWGSGKSSMLNLLEDELEKSGQKHAVSVVRFEPWLVGERDNLLSQLFSELTAAIDKAMPQGDDVDTPAAKQLSDLSAKIRSYSSKLKGTPRVADFLGLIGIPGMSELGKVMKAAIDAGESIGDDKTLAESKDEIASALASSTHRFVIIIDDLDRLEPREANEILRLVRAVADFPNVVYLLSYDPDIVASNIEASLNIASGQTYLKKIVQVSVTVPLPESFDLRRWFSRDLGRISNLDTGTLGPEVVDRLQQVIDREGGRRLRTPRDVAHALNAMRVYWPALEGKVDFADLVWLQLIRMDNPEFYRWIETYVGEMAALDNGAQIPKHERNRLVEDFTKCLENDRLEFDDVFSLYVDILPGIELSFVNGADSVEPKLAQSLEESDKKKLLDGKRLGSPLHYRLYFSLDRPAGALADDEWIRFIESSKTSSRSALHAFLSLTKEARPQGGTKAEIVLERLLGLPPDDVETDQASNLVFVLSNAMDEVANVSGETIWGESISWRHARRILQSMWRSVDAEERQTTLDLAFRHGKAIGWLTHVFRDEIFAHGLFGDRPADESEWIFDQAEFSRVVEIMQSRYKSESVDNMLSAPGMLNILFAWQQSGDSEGPKGWASNVSKDDEGLLKLLQGMRTWRAVNGDVRYPLTKSNVGRFIDYDEAEKRVKEIFNDPATKPEQRTLAKGLLTAFEHGRDDLD